MEIGKIEQLTTKSDMSLEDIKYRMIRYFIEEKGWSRNEASYTVTLAMKYKPDEVIKNIRGEIK